MMRLLDGGAGDRTFLPTAEDRRAFDAVFAEKMAYRVVRVERRRQREAGIRGTGAR
jgi:hypothetical protein